MSCTFSKLARTHRYSRLFGFAGNISLTKKKKKKTKIHAGVPGGGGGGGGAAPDPAFLRFKLSLTGYRVDWAFRQARTFFIMGGPFFPNNQEASFLW